MLRNHHLADLITLGNGAAGAAAIMWMMSYLTQPDPWRLYTALALLPLALRCDVLDGRAARSRHEHSSFGQELDSLAEVVSFGVATAAPAYGLGLEGGLDCRS